MSKFVVIRDDHSSEEWIAETHYWEIEHGGALSIRWRRNAMAVAAYAPQGWLYVRGPHDEEVPGKP